MQSTSDTMFSLRYWLQNYNAQYGVHAKYTLSLQFRKLALQCYAVTSLELRNGKVNRQKCAGGRRLTGPVGALREKSGTGVFRLFSDCHNCVRNVPVALLVTHCDWPAVNCRFRRVQSVAYRGPEVRSSGTVQCRNVYPSARPDLLHPVTCTVKQCTLHRNVVSSSPVDTLQHSAFIN